MRYRFLTLLLILGVLMSACGAGQTTDVTSTPAPTETPIPLPTLTATPTVPLAMLILPASLDAETSNLYQTTVYDLAQAAGMRFQVRNTLTPAELEPGLKIVIALPPDPGVLELAAAAPDVQFLAINIPGIAAGGNISVLGGNSQTEIVGFLAGYTGAMLTDDYRIGMLMPRDNADAIKMFNSFGTGMKFYCGICRSYFFFQQPAPAFIDIGSEQNPDDYDAFADVLISQYRIRTILMYPEIQTQDLVDYVGTTGTLMIGSISPEQHPAGWIMTIQPDTIKAIQTAWPYLLAGQGGQTIQSPLGLSDIDPSILSPGKQALVQETLDKLQAGRIAP